MPRRERELMMTALGALFADLLVKGKTLAKDQGRWKLWLNPTGGAVPKRPAHSSNAQTDLGAARSALGIDVGVELRLLKCKFSTFREDLHALKV